MDIQVIASGSSGNAYLISDGKTDLLLDAGVSVKSIKIACNFTMSKIKGCFITHAHGDHSKAVKDILKIGINVYTSQGTIETCGLTGHRVHRVKALEEFTVGTFKILPFDVRHDVVEPLGFLFTSIETKEKLLYFTDTYYLTYKFNGLTHIMAECNYDNETLMESVQAGYVGIERVARLMKSHMSLAHLLDFFKANDLSKVKEIYLLHLSNTNSNKSRCKEEVQKLTGTEVYVYE